MMPTGPAVKVELFDPSAELLLDSNDKQLFFVVRCKVKYRFPDGVPQDGQGYLVRVNTGEGVADLQIGEGRNYTAEGEVHGTYMLWKASRLPLREDLKQANINVIKPKPEVLPKQVSFGLARGVSPGPTRDIKGGTVSCKVKVKDSYRVP